MSTTGYTREVLELGQQWCDWSDMEESEGLNAANCTDDSERMHYDTRAQFAFDNVVRVQAELEKKHGIKETDLDDLLYAILEDRDREANP